MVTLVLKCSRLGNELSVVVIRSLLPRRKPSSRVYKEKVHHGQDVQIIVPSSVLFHFHEKQNIIGLMLNDLGKRHFMSTGYGNSALQYLDKERETDDSGMQPVSVFSLGTKLIDNTYSNVIRLSQ